MVRGFNQRWVGRPRRIVVCRTAGEVRDAVERALDDGLRITVRSGGHCYEDFVSGNEGGVILDLSPLSGVYRDDATGRYCVEAGATLWNVYGRLYKEFDVTLPGGSCYSVGAGGHVTGGGYGLLSRLHGLTVDYLDAIELVHVSADGTVGVITVSRDGGDRAERELLWAHLGGGGGNFGVVTRFWFRDLPSAPAEAHLLTHAWNWSDLNERSFASLVDGLWHVLRGQQRPRRPVRRPVRLAASHPELEFRRADRADGPVRRERTVAPGYVRARRGCRASAADGASGACGLPPRPRRGHARRRAHAVAGGHATSEWVRDSTARQVQVRLHDSCLPASAGGGDVEVPGHRPQGGHPGAPTGRLLRLPSQRRLALGDRLAAALLDHEAPVSGLLGRCERRRGQPQVDAQVLRAHVRPPRPVAGRCAGRLLRQLSGRRPRRLGVPVLQGQLTHDCKRSRLAGTRRTSSTTPSRSACPRTDDSGTNPGDEGPVRAPAACVVGT